MPTEYILSSAWQVSSFLIYFSSTYVNVSHISPIMDVYVDLHRFLLIPTTHFLD